jgi:hypothetical protein
MRLAFRFCGAKLASEAGNEKCIRQAGFGKVPYGFPTKDLQEGQPSKRSDGSPKQDCLGPTLNRKPPDKKVPPWWRGTTAALMK